MSKLERIEKEILHLCGRDLDGDCSYTIHYKIVAKLILSERDKRDQESTQLKEQLSIYQQAINRIDDHFEYGYDSVLDKLVVVRIIDGITEQLRASVKGVNSD